MPSVDCCLRSGIETQVVTGASSQVLTKQHQPNFPIKLYLTMHDNRLLTDGEQVQFHKRIQILKSFDSVITQGKVLEVR